MPYRFAPFTLDADSRVLRRESAAISLTARGFDLLVLLVRERPKAVAKEDLLKTLWPDSFVADGSLAQLVTEVRQALGDDARDPKYIRTVFRYGYSFVAEAHEEDERRIRSAASPFFVLWRGQQIPLRRGDNVIGRDVDAQIRIVSTQASRRHARIQIEDTRALLSDLGSRNGTFIGDRRVTDEQPLADGDQIVIGDDVIVFCGANAPTTTGTGSVVKTGVR
jgi:DNA-binding winged helix-turn-helix (wHTH) protein